MTPIQKDQNGKVIVTTFAGREDRMSILLEYLKRALDEELIDEYHIWDFARSPEDAQWLGKISELYSTPAHINKFYQPRLSLNKMDHLSLQIKTNLDVYLEIFNYNKSKSIIVTLDNQRISIVDGVKENYLDFPLEEPILSAVNFSEFFLQNQNNKLKIQQQDRILAEFPMEMEWDHFQVSSKGRAEWIFNDQLHKIKLFRCEKSAPHWEEYYTYYSEIKHRNDIFIKMDDDLVYLDLKNLKSFVEFRKSHPEFFLVSANVVNNGVCAYYQQNYGAIDRSLMDFPYDAFRGKLWESGILAEKLHRYFIHNADKFQYGGYIKLPLGDRLSINCVSWLGRDWEYMHEFNYYDEEQMSQQAPKKLKRSNVIYNPFIISHLSFYSQEHQMDLKDLIVQYQGLISE